MRKVGDRRREILHSKKVEKNKKGGGGGTPCISPPSPPLAKFLSIKMLTDQAYCHVNLTWSSLPLRTGEREADPDPLNANEEDDRAGGGVDDALAALEQAEGGKDDHAPQDGVPKDALVDSKENEEKAEQAQELEAVAELGEFCRLKGWEWLD